MDIPKQEAIYLDGIADYLSDQIGFCVNSFSFYFIIKSHIEKNIY